MDIFNYLICAETDDAYLRFGPYYSDEPVTIHDIKRHIQEQLILNEMQSYTPERVCHVEFFAFNGEVIFEQKLDISDVWPKFKNKPFNPLRKEVKKTTNGKEFFCKDCSNNKM